MGWHDAWNAHGARDAARDARNAVRDARNADRDARNADRDAWHAAIDDRHATWYAATRIVRAKQRLHDASRLSAAFGGYEQYRAAESSNGRNATTVDDDGCSDDADDGTRGRIGDGRRATGGRGTNGSRRRPNRGSRNRQKVLRRASLRSFSA